MKALYHINKWLVIVNAFLFIIPSLGLIFLILLGFVQIIMALAIGFSIEKYNKDIKFKFISYAILTILVLSLLLYTSNEASQSVLNFNSIVIPIIVISILLAFLHLHITYIITKTSRK